MSVAATSGFFPAGTQQQIRYLPKPATAQTVHERRVRRRSVVQRQPLGQVITGPWPQASSNSQVVRSEATLALNDEHYDRDYVSYLWSEDWDCPEDAAYDEL